MAIKPSAAELHIILKYMSEMDQALLDQSRFRKSLGGTKLSFTNLTKVGRVAERAMLGVGIALGAAGVAAIKMTMDFDKTMSNVKAKTGATAEEFVLLRKTAMELGAATIYSASEAADGMALLGAAGMDTNDVVAAMPGLLDGAAASQADFATMTDIGVTAMSAFGLAAKDMGRISDVLAMGANVSTAEMTDLGEAITYVGPVAKAVGVTLEDTVAALGLLANAGIRGSMAGTSLRMAFVQLAKPAKAAQELMDKIGWSATEANGEFKPMSKMLVELKGKFANLTQAEKLHAAATIFGTRSAAAMLVLIEKGGDAYDEYSAAMGTATGYAAEQAKVMNDNLAGAMEQMRGSLETLSISLITMITPQLIELAGGVEKYADAWNAMSPEEQQKIIDKAIKLAKVVGALWLAPKVWVGGKIMLGALGEIYALAKLVLIKLGLIEATGAAGAGVGGAAKAGGAAAVGKAAAGAAGGVGAGTVAGAAAVGLGTAAVITAGAYGAGAAINYLNELGRAENIAGVKTRAWSSQMEKDLKTVELSYGHVRDQVGEVARAMGYLPRHTPMTIGIGIKATVLGNIPGVGKLHFTPSSQLQPTYKGTTRTGMSGSVNKKLPPRHSGGPIPYSGAYNLQRGEYVLQKKAVEQINKGQAAGPTFDFRGAQFVNVTRPQIEEWVGAAFKKTVRSAGQLARA